MKKITFQIEHKTLLADTITPVSIYLKLRDQYPNTIMLESSDYRANENSFSFICFQPVASFLIEQETITTTFPDDSKKSSPITNDTNVSDLFEQFLDSFSVDGNQKTIPVDGFFGYTTYDAVKYFEDIELTNQSTTPHSVPEMRYSFYKYIIAINHFKNELIIFEHLTNGEASSIERIESLLYNKNIATYHFVPSEMENSNITDDEYMSMVTSGKEHCYRGDVIQIVLSRQYNQKYTGDDFNVYRALRSINPSPYLFYFDYGNYKIFGSSPEAQLIIKDKVAYINPIAGTYKRTGDDQADEKLAEKLLKDKKEKAEHVMLVDLARNDLSRNATDVKVDIYGEIQFYSHVLHMVSKVSGKLPEDTNIIRVMGDSFPAGTLSGAPKYKAMELIDKYENQNRGYYGGCIGYIGLNGDFNHAIMIRSFLCKDNFLFYQAGAGIVSESKEENELAEVNNKLAALKSAIQLAKNIQ